MATPVVGPNALGRPEVIAKIATFPIVQPDWWCRMWEQGAAQEQPKPKAFQLTHPLKVGGLRS